ncbi:MAG: hypothetical protein KF900_07330 [Bacteroidetes bacterium]|nr:hypothetical protein [Bacteroidota bacterium]
MKNIKLSASQIYFGLTFLLCLCFLKDGLDDFLFYYFCFLWIWLAYIARKTAKHELADGYGRRLVNVNIILCPLSMLLIIVMGILTTSLFVRIILFGKYPFIPIIILGFGALVFMFSIIAHIVIATKNFLKIAPEQKTSKIVLRLLVYPLGIFTLLETLKKNKSV